MFLHECRVQYVVHKMLLKEKKNLKVEKNKRKIMDFAKPLKKRMYKSAAQHAYYLRYDRNWSLFNGFVGRFETGRLLLS